MESHLDIILTEEEVDTANIHRIHKVSYYLHDININEFREKLRSDIIKLIKIEPLIKKILIRDICIADANKGEPLMYRINDKAKENLIKCGYNEFESKVYYAKDL